MRIESMSFAGGGRVARILIGGLKRAGALPGKVLVYDQDQAALERLMSLHPSVETVPDPILAAAADIVFLAVHPPEIGGVMSHLSQGLRGHSVLVSLAPVATLERLKGMAGGHGRIVRMIPNAPSIVGKGYNPIVFGEGVPEDEKTLLVDFFSSWGQCPQVPEDHLELYAVIAAMGPTYLWPILFALEELGRSFGLADSAARDTVTRMTEGAVAVLDRSGLSEDEIMDLIPVKPLEDATAEHVEKCRDTLAELVKKLERARR